MESKLAEFRRKLYTVPPAGDLTELGSASHMKMKPTEAQPKNRVNISTRVFVNVLHYFNDRPLHVMLPKSVKTLFWVNLLKLTNGTL